MIPKHFVEKNLDKAKGSSFFGVLFEDMTRNELIACAVAGWDGLYEQQKENARNLEFILSLRD